MLTTLTLQLIKILSAAAKSLINRWASLIEQCASWLLQRYANEILINGLLNQTINLKCANYMLDAVYVHGYIMRSKKWIERCLQWPSNTFRGTEKYIFERFAIVWQLNEILNSPSRVIHVFPPQKKKNCSLDY